MGTVPPLVCVGVVGGDESLPFSWLAAAAAATIDFAPTMESIENPSFEPLVVGVTTEVAGLGRTEEDMVSVTRVMPSLGLFSDLVVGGGSLLKLDSIQMIVFKFVLSIYTEDLCNPGNDITAQTFLYFVEDKLFV